MNDGGPAFPMPAYGPPDEYSVNARNGMSLRDWFAGQALMGYIALGVVVPKPDAAALSAYNYADAMLAERKKAK